MTVRIDKAGRIVLPKGVRDRMRLHAGTELLLEEGQDGLILRPRRRRPSLKDENGLLVHTGELGPGLDWTSAVEDSRDERLRDLAGF